MNQQLSFLYERPNTSYYSEAMSDCCCGLGKNGNVVEQEERQETKQKYTDNVNNMKRMCTPTTIIVVISSPGKMSKVSTNPLVIQNTHYQQKQYILHRKPPDTRIQVNARLSKGLPYKRITKATTLLLCSKLLFYSDSSVNCQNCRMGRKGNPFFDNFNINATKPWVKTVSTRSTLRTNYASNKSTAYSVEISV